HILEASEPYELLANLLGIAQGERFSSDRFPPHPGGRPKSPGEKIAAIEIAAGSAEMPQVAAPLREIWDRDLRNSIFHADYSLYGGELRTLKPLRRYTNREVGILVNRAWAYFQSISTLLQTSVASYDEPVLIEGVYPGFSRDPEDRARVIVREGHG